MQDNKYLKGLKRSSFGFGCAMIGVFVTLLITKYDGIIEVKLEKESSYLKVDGYPQCHLVSHVK